MEHPGIQFDHIGIVVPTLEAGREQLSALFDVKGWTQEFADPINQVYVQFCLDSSDICYELISPLGPESPIMRALKERKTILNHMAYLVGNLDGAAVRMRGIGAIPTGAARPAIAYGGHRIQFFLTRPGFLLELVEAMDHKHSFESGERFRKLGTL